MSDLHSIIANASLKLCFVLFLMTDFIEASLPSNTFLQALDDDHIFVREKTNVPYPVLQHPGLCIMTIQRWILSTFMDLYRSALVSRDSKTLKNEVNYSLML